MKRVAQFKKVSAEQFAQDFIDAFGIEVAEEDVEKLDNKIKEIYNNIKLPTRATKGSAGYDFFSPISLEFTEGGTVKIPTGVRCEINEGFVLKIYPRSSLGFKNRLQLDNTVGIIDSDYQYADNEGHIFIKMTCDSKKPKTFKIEEGEAFAQGIFEQYFITVDDEVKTTRKGGIGSTNK